MRFDDYTIAKEIKKSLDKMAFKRPTDIQFKAIPSILKGEDVLAIAQTGTGKTAAFAIPVLNILHYKKKDARRKDGIKCVVMAPTHELAIQITDVFKEIGRFTRIKILGIFGGVEQAPQIQKLEKGVDILVATPGRLFDLRAQGHLDLSRVEILIVDEADHMLDMGFLGDIHDLLKHLPERRQTLFFSATINAKIKKLAYKLVYKPIRIQISPKDPVARNIDHAVAFVEMDHKRFFLERMVKENPESKILVFVRTKVRAERVMKAMERVNIKSLTLHSDKDQKTRLKVLNTFKTGEVKMLIATDVTARGIDIPNVDFVINYDMPEQSENYVHRVGRTGRGKNKGQAYSFCSLDEQKILEEIQSFLGKEIAIVNMDKNDYLDTVDSSMDAHADWKTLMKETEELEEKRRKRKKRKKF